MLPAILEDQAPAEAEAAAGNCADPSNKFPLRPQPQLNHLQRGDGKVVEVQGRSGYVMGRLGVQMVKTAICFLLGAICPLLSVTWLIVAH
jgi:hypothetical protein